MKKIDLNKTVNELVKEYPEVADIMAELGFKEITSALMLNSVGRVMTIPKGAAMKNIPLEAIVRVFQNKGFEVEGSSSETETKDVSEQRLELLKQYLRRLGEGEDLVSVRKDFVSNFANVEASEILKAEQELIAEGTPITEIQKLCDLHSALFHSSTTAETIQISRFSKEQTPFNVDMKYDETAYIKFKATEGHPLYSFSLENKNLETLIAEARALIANGEDLKAVLLKIREVSVHYAKKGDLIYPHLKVRYDVFGPSSVMWTIDDEIRDELAKLAKTMSQDEEWMESFVAVLDRMEEMIYKEENILYPVCAKNFTKEEWHKLYQDSKDYAPCLGHKPAVWEEAEAELTKAKDEPKSQALRPAQTEGEIVMPGGHMTVEEMTAMLNTIPLEITFVDANDINKFFNEGPKDFKRPQMAIDRDVYSCHPPKIEAVVRGIISDFRSGKRDRVQVWMEKNGKTMLVSYYAVRDKEKKFLGTLELVQDMEEIKEHFKIK